MQDQATKADKPGGILASKLTWQVFYYVLAIDWATKWLVNKIVPVGEVFPKSGALIGSARDGFFIAIRHAEHWAPESDYKIRSDVIEVALQWIENLIERIIPYDVPSWTLSFALLSIPLVLILLGNAGKTKTPLTAKLAFGLLLAALIGNKVELWLFGHVTDWIALGTGGLKVMLYTNIADIAITAGYVCWFWPSRSSSGQGNPTKTE